MDMKRLKKKNMIILKEELHYQMLKFIKVRVIKTVLYQCSQ